MIARALGVGIVLWPFIFCALLGLRWTYRTARAWCSDLLHDLLAPDARRHHIAYAVWAWATTRTRSSR